MDQNLPIATYRKLEIAEENIYLLGGQLGWLTEEKNVNIDFIKGDFLKLFKKSLHVIEKCSY